MSNPSFLLLVSDQGEGPLGMPIGLTGTLGTDTAGKGDEFGDEGLGIWFDIFGVLQSVESICR